MRLAVDIDDVIYPWWDTAHAICEKAGITNGRLPTQWEMYRDYGVTLEEWLEVIDKAVLDGSLYGADPFPDSVVAAKELVAFGHSIHLVTSRGYFDNGHIIRGHTATWLADWEFPHNSLTFTKDKTIVRADAAVDDALKYIGQFVAMGTPTWMVDAPHNQNVEAEWAPRVKSFAEFAEIILNLEDL